MMPITNPNNVLVVRKWCDRFAWVRYLRDEPGFTGIWSTTYDTPSEAYYAAMASMESDENPIIHIECWRDAK